MFFAGFSNMQWIHLRTKYNIQTPGCIYRKHFLQGLEVHNCRWKGKHKLPLSDGTNFVVAQSARECWEMTRRYKDQDKFNLTEVRAIACSPYSHAAKRSYVLVVFQSLPYESFWRWRWGLSSSGSCIPSFPLCCSMFHTVHTDLSILKFPQLDLPFPSL